MNHRSLRADSLVAGAPTRNISHHHHHRALGLSKDDDHNHLDLFSNSRPSLSLASSDESSHVSVKLGRLSLGSTKPTKNGLDDLLSSTDGGKHDYDWLLTPPGTPLFPTTDGNETQTAAVAPRSSSLARSISTTKASRLSVSQSSENNNRPRPARSSSVTRPSVSTTQYSTYSNKSSSILNTSSASVSSYIRPSTPSSRTSSTARPSTPSSRPTLSRSSTPSKARPTPSASSADKVRPSQNSRPSTPTSRPQISSNLNSPAARPTPSASSADKVRPSQNSTTSRPQISSNLNSPAARPTSRPSTPTRRNSAPSLSPASGPSNSVGRSLQNGPTLASISRPSSPSPRVRSTQQPIVLPDFPLETPPNLRTTLPDRPLSAGRSRPGVAVTLKGNVENPGAASLPRRQSSPNVTRGRLSEPSARGRVLANGQVSHTTEYNRAPHVSEVSARKPLKTSTESTGFGRTISKKSLDMAIRHMDIRNGTNGNRPLSGSTLFPQSIRCANTKGQVSPNFSAQASGNGDIPIFRNGGTTEHGIYVSRSLEDGHEEDKSQFSAKLTVADIYESSRYEALLLKEDLKNTNWLHSLEDKYDQGAIFDNGFEPLPEPFDPL